MPENVIAKEVKGDQSSDDDEEVFHDVDRVKEEKEKGKKKQAEAEEKAASLPKSNYDPLKREPKYSNAKDSPIWELVCLSNHCHPTIRFWSEILAKGGSIAYAGDPLLDLGLANFLDRFAYKNPRTGDKAQAHRQRMAQYEKPVTEINFRQGEMPDVARPEEEFLYKYMKERPEKAVRRDAKGGETTAEGEEEDPDMEAFVNEEMDREMKRMAGGFDADDEDLDDQDVDMDIDDEEGEAEISEADGFFSGDDDLEDVAIDGDDEEGEELAEEGSYGSEVGMQDFDAGDDEDEGELLPSEEQTSKNPKKAAKDLRKTKAGTKFASYEEFAHLLEDGLEDGGSKSKRPRDFKGIG